MKQLEQGGNAEFYGWLANELLQAQGLWALQV